RRVQRILLPHLEGREWPVVVEMLAQELAQEALVRSHIRIIGQCGALTNDPVAQCGASDAGQQPSRRRDTRAALTQRAAGGMAEEYGIVRRQRGVTFVAHVEAGRE